MSGSLKLIYESIVSKSKTNIDYWIPRPWLGHDTVPLETKDNAVKVDPFDYFQKQLGEILKSGHSGTHFGESLSRVKKLSLKSEKIKDKHSNRLPGDWMASSQIYGLYIRNFSAYDHNQDGELGGESSDITMNAQGIRETGTFLKSIALLPYIQSMGFDSVYLLPVALTGSANKKGELGSPYGLKNPFKINPLYHDPLVDEFGVETEFKAFVEAAHRLGMRVILDFVPRTAARDSDFIKEHPEWFYWIDRAADKNYHSPEFTKDELQKIHWDVDPNNNPDRVMVPPHGDYLNLFHEAPSPDEIELISEREGYVAKTKEGELVVPGAFADWPPDDVQPPWTDVTYLKLYDDSDFNYVAYNTVRMYDGRIHKINSSLWDTLADIIPFYQEEFGIDGARIDMGHALPHDLERKIIEQARKTDSDFGFLSEDFNVRAEARKNGYNVVMGNSWWMFPRARQASDNGDSIAKSFLKDLYQIPNPVLGSPETADTPRAASRRGGIRFSQAIWTLVSTLPNFVPFCTAGFELGDTEPTNLGLDFTPEEIAAHQGKPLAFFDRAALKWDSPYFDEMKEMITRMNSFRKENIGVIMHIDNFQWVDNKVDGYPAISPENPVFSFIRAFQEEFVTILTGAIFGESLFPIEIDHDYLIAVNMDGEREVISTLFLNDDSEWENIFNEERYKTVDKELNLRLKPGEAVIAAKL